MVIQLLGYHEALDAPTARQSARRCDAPRGRLRALLALLLHCAPLAALLLAAAPERAYVPAVPTNDTAAAQAAGLNLSDTSTLNVLFYPAGNFTTRVSYQLVGADSSGISQVRLPHRPWPVRLSRPPVRLSRELA